MHARVRSRSYAGALASDGAALLEAAWGVTALALPAAHAQRLIPLPGGAGNGICEQHAAAVSAYMAHEGVRCRRMRARACVRSRAARMRAHVL
jgi:hypothetical protein